MSKSKKTNKPKTSNHWENLADYYLIVSGYGANPQSCCYESYYWGASYRIVSWHEMDTSLVEARTMLQDAVETHNDGRIGILTAYPMATLPDGVTPGVEYGETGATLTDEVDEVLSAYAMCPKWRVIDERIVSRVKTGK